MQCSQPDLARLSDDDLISAVKRLAEREKEATADLIASLAELDERRLYLAAGCSSLFTYCVQVLALSESSAYFRIEAARAARKFPTIIERLASGAVTLTAVKMLAPHLTSENHRGVLDEAAGRTKRQIEEIVARLQPRPDARASVRKLPGTRVAVTGDVEDERRKPDLRGATDVAPEALSPTGDVTVDMVAFGQLPDTGSKSAFRSSPATPAAASPALATSPATGVAPSAASAATSTAVAAPSPEISCAPRTRASIVLPLAPERYKIQMTVGVATRHKLRRAQELLRHSVPDGDVAVIFDQALTLLLERLERNKCALTQRAQRREKRANAPALDAALLAAAPVALDAPLVLERVGEAADVAVDSGRQLAPERLQQPRRERAEGRRQERRLHPAGRGDDGLVGEHGDDRRREGAAERRKEPVAKRTRERGGGRGARTRCGAAAVSSTHRPVGKPSRYIPASVRRAVWRRDGGRCSFIGSEGRCRETGMLEYHHVVPYADGGQATVENLRLECARHNRLEAERFFGPGNPPGSA